MKLSNHSIVLMLLGVVVLAGCVVQPSGGGAGVGGNAGIVIKSLQVSPTQTYSDGSVVIVTADIQNVGSFDASNVQANIYGLDGWGCSLATTPQSSLPGANPSLGTTQGAETFATWQCKSPSNIQNVIPYTFTVRVSYNYKTILNAVLKAVDVNYFRQTNTPGGVSSSSSTSGPLTIAVKAPTVVATSKNIPIQFEITNSGGGRVGDPTVSTQLDNIKTITAAQPLSGCPTSAFLGGGTKTIIGCIVDTSSIPTGGFGNLNLQLTLEYNYFVDAAQTVTVLPISGTTGSGTITSTTTTTTAQLSQCVRPTVTLQLATGVSAGSSVPHGSGVTPTVSALAGSSTTAFCDGGTVKLIILDGSGNIVGNCKISNSQCQPQFAAPSTAGTYSYQAFVDIDGNNIISGTEPFSQPVSITVS